MTQVPLKFIRRWRRSLGFTMAEIMIICMVIGVLAAIAVPSFNSMYESIKLDHAIAELRTSISQSQRIAIQNATDCESSLLVKLSTKNTPFQSDIGSTCGTPSSPSIAESISVYSNLVSTPMDDMLVSNRVLVASSNRMMADAQSMAARPGPSKMNNGSDKGKAWWKNDDSDDDDSGDNGSDDIFDQKTEKKPWTKWTLGNCEKWKGCSPSDRRNIGFVTIGFGNQGAINYEIQENPGVSTGTIVALSTSKPEGKMKCIVMSRRLGLTRIGHYTGTLISTEMTDNGQCTTEEWSKQ